MKELARWVRDARERTLALVADRPDDALMGPRLETVNPRLWELGHVAWFQEWWCLRRDGRPSIRPDADALFDSARVPHRVRWDLPLPDRAGVLRYLGDVRDAVLERLNDPRLDPRDLYFVRLAVFHEDMHDESFTWTRQTLREPPPPFAAGPEAAGAGGGGAPGGDALVPGGTYEIGADAREPFVFDNEKWVHPVEVAPFAMARCATTEAEFAAFVGDGGYGRRAWWTDEGWAWREGARAEHPLYWSRDGASFTVEEFGRRRPLAPRRAVVHVNAHEADAYARWAGRRLPTEAEWEVAAAGGAARRARPWGDAPASAERANLEGSACGCTDVGARAAGDSAHGVRQMWGNVWEWTATPFSPYPGFVVDPYAEYSQPWFHTHRVLRGGCFATRARLLRNTWRNFFTPDRRDVFAGFRTCAAAPGAAR